MEIKGKFVDGVWFAAQEYAAFLAAQRLLERRPVNMMIAGPSGYGKTARPRAWAAELGMGFSVVNVPLIRDTPEVFGVREVRGGETHFILNEMVEAMMAGNHVILLDELNRAEPWVMNALLPLLDFRRSTIVYGHRVTVGPKVMFVCTANRGWAFSGTFQEDAALINRMEITFDVAIPPVEIEAEILRRQKGVNAKQATAIAEIIAKIRRARVGALVDASPRTSLNVADLVMTGLPLRSAFEIALVNTVAVDARKDLVDLLNTESGPVPDWEEYYV